MQLINPVLSGMMQGFSVGNMIRQSALQQEAAEREKLRFEHEQQVNDIQTRMSIAQHTKPILAGGMVSEELLADLPEFDPSNPGKPKISKQRTRLMRPVDRARMVRYKGADGQTVEGELLSPEEQTTRAFATKLEETRAMAQLQNASALDQIRGREEILEPGRTRQRDFARSQAAENRDFQTGRDATTRKFQADQAAATRAHQAKLANVNNDARERMNRDDNAAVDRRLTWSEKVAKTREDKAAKAETEAAEKEVKKQESVIQTRLDSLQQSEAAIHAKRKRAGAMGTQLGKNQPSGWKKDLEKLNAEMSGLDQQLKEIVEQKNELLTRKKGLRPGKAADLYGKFGL